MRPGWTAWGLAGLGLAMAALGQAQPAAEQIKLGKDVYVARCASCHGAAGQGDKGPALIGENHNLRGYGTAKDLYEYTRKVMPADRPGRMLEAQYWAVLAYILNENRLLPEATTKLDRDNAAQIALDH
jgi:mono/diheme cytochrome c family protein